MANDQISKIKTEKINAQSIAACLLAEGLDPVGEIDVTMPRLAKHFMAKDPGDLFECSECNAPFPGRIKACCPFCAIDDDGNLVENVTPQTFGAPADVQAPTNAGEPDAKTKKIQERAAKKAAAAQAKKPNPAPKTPEPSAPVVDAVIEEQAKEKAKDETAKSAALAKREEKTKLARAGEEELDKAVAEIRALKSDVAHSYWELGKKLQEVHDRQLYKQRLDEEGKPGVYKTSGFDAWVREEVGFTVPSAYQIMDVAKHYSEAQVKAFGYAKLGLLLKAPEAAQAKILAEKVEQGATWREVRMAVEESRKADPNARRPARDGSARGSNTNGGRKPKVLSVPGGPPPEKTTKKDVITIASIPKRQKVTIYAKPEKRGAEPKPAKKLTDEPYFIIAFENDVSMKVTLSQNAKGELQAICDAKREDDDEAKAAE